MTQHWTFRVARRIIGLATPAERFPAENVDRDAQRVRQELDLIRIRFPHHG